MTVVPLLRRHPLSIAVVALSVLLSLLAPLLVVEPDFPHPMFRVVTVGLLIASVIIAEWRLGTIATLVIGVVAPLVAFGVCWIIVTIDDSVSRLDLFLASGHHLWAPSSAAVALLVAAAHTMPVRVRTRVIGAITTVVLALLLYAGHASDLMRALALVVGIVAGRVLLERRSIPLVSAPTSGRGAVVASGILGIAGLGTLCTLLVPDPDGILSVFDYVLYDPVTLIVGVLLLLAAALTAQRRRGGLVLAVIVEAALALLLGWTCALQPALLGEFDWRGLSPDELTDELVLLTAWVVPTAVIALLIVLRTRLVRRARSIGPDQRDRMRAQLARSNAGSLGHMGIWAGNAHWFDAPTGGAIAYRVRCGVAVTVSDPAALPEDREGVMLRFARFAEESGWTPVFYSVHEDTASALDSHGWNRVPIGVEAVLPLAAFDLTGKRRADLRTASNRAEREGLRAEWVRFDQLDEDLTRQVADICGAWAGRGGLPQMGFTLGGFRELDDPDVRLMIAVETDGRVQAVTSWLPVMRHGRVDGWTLDVMRKRGDAMPGVMEFLIARTALRARDEGLAEVSLSATPLSPGPHDGRWGRVTGAVARALEPAYGFGSLHRFKAKFQPVEEPLWLVHPDPVRLPRIARALASVYLPRMSALQLARLGRVLVHRPRSRAAASR